MTTNTAETWDGSRLNAPFLALEVLPGNAPPGTATVPLTAAASDSKGVWLIAEGQLGAFLQVHQDTHLVCVSAGELHRRLYDHLAADATAQQLLWRFVADGQLSDVGLLDQLLRLAQAGASRPPRRSLELLAAKYASGTLADSCEAGSRARAAALVFVALWQEASNAGLLSPGAVSTGAFGLLSLALQVQGDVALTHARPDRLHLAQEAIKNLEARWHASWAANEAILMADKEARQCFKTPKGGRGFRLEPRRKRLEGWLGRLLLQVRGLHTTDFSSPLRTDGRPSERPEAWEPLTRSNRLLRAWSELAALQELMRSWVPDGSPLSPRYEALPRIRSRGPDLSTLRRVAGAGLFRPAPGHRFLVVRLQDLELRALAAVCQRRVGQSRLADLFIKGIDPCCHCAAGLAELSLSDFAALAVNAPGEYDRWLRLARALLMAAPMGFSPQGVCEVARAEFGLDDLGLAEAQKAHGRLLDSILPELRGYLEDDTVEVLASNLQMMPQQLRSSLVACKLPHGPSPHEVRGWFRKDSSLSPELREKLLMFLGVWNANDALRPLIKRQAFNHELYVALFGRPVTTLTGRVRGGLLFPEARQAQYLDVADDAAKSALFALVEGGFTLVADADNDIIIEIPANEEQEVQAIRAEDLARRAIEAILDPVPASSEVCPCDSW